MTNFEQHRNKLLEQITNLQDHRFEEVALELFHYQYEFNELYRQFVDLLKIKIENISTIEAIPFLPIDFFKQNTIKTGDIKEKIIFSSSGTTGQITSKHYVTNTELYRLNARLGFAYFYGNVSDFCFLALLPNYLEREGSSLVYMAEDFIAQSKYKSSGFFLYEQEKLIEELKKNQAAHIPTVLLGVSYALLDLAEAYQVDLSNVIIMETGGMKGKRKEITRDELHAQLKQSFNVKVIHSEYGMTELLSQGYSKGNGLFYPSPSMKILTSEITDPLTTQQNGKNGVVQVIDLANIDSCAFIATQDIGVVYADGGFEIKGRLDNSDIRGCNLMVE
jgi:phenylacetate-coenzyme A ligase PaaK-like adenylate-forming protein